MRSNTTHRVVDAALAHEMKLPVLTGDPELKAMADTGFIDVIGCLDEDLVRDRLAAIPLLALERATT